MNTVHRGGGGGVSHKSNVQTETIQAETNRIWKFCFFESPENEMPLQKTNQLHMSYIQ